MPVCSHANTPALLLVLLEVSIGPGFAKANVEI